MTVPFTQWDRWFPAWIRFVPGLSAGDEQTMRCANTVAFVCCLRTTERKDRALYSDVCVSIKRITRHVSMYIVFVLIDIVASVVSNWGWKSWTIIWEIWLEFFAKAWLREVKVIIAQSRCWCCCWTPHLQRTFELNLLCRIREQCLSYQKNIYSQNPLGSVLWSTIFGIALFVIWTTLRTMLRHSSMFSFELNACN